MLELDAAPPFDGPVISFDQMGPISLKPSSKDWPVTEFIGHSDVRTTYNRYGKVVPEDLALAAIQLEEYFDRGRANLALRLGAGLVVAA